MVASEYFDYKTALSFLTGIKLTQWLLLACGVLAAHTLVNYVYNAFFHPLSKYLGPRLALVSNFWEIYHLGAGKWPWVLESALEKYDIHGPKRDLRGTFIKTPMVDGLGDEDDGLLWERNPEKHRRIAKTMSPAFSGKSLRMKEPTMNKHIDLMIERMKEHGAEEKGMDLSTWLNWLCMDVAADHSCNWEMHQVRDMKNHSFLEAMEAANFLVVVMAAAKTFPVISPIALLFAPWKILRSLPTMISEMRSRIVERIETRNNLKHSDYFEQLLPADKVVTQGDKRIRHMLTVAGQLLLGGYDPTSVAIYMLFHFILQHSAARERLVSEIRGSVSSYQDIDAETLRTLPWLNACLSETLRLSSSATHHSLPRLSPGAVVTGEYIPKDVLCRTSLFTYNRSSRFYHDPRSFRPERWLSPDHPAYNPKFAGDDHSAHLPFIMGPRQCPGREVARIMFRLVVAKVFWSFDVEQVSRQLDFDRDFRVYGMWQKPELRVRLVPTTRV